MRTQQHIQRLILLALLFISCKDKPEKPQSDISLIEKELVYQEPYRPQFHFSPSENWMNDPNGLVYHNGTFHLYYQYYPQDIVWGPMHWGHAVSRDMVYWEHKPIALFPDENGYIFSGSAVHDVHNSSEFGTMDDPPLVAIYTYHNMDKEQAGDLDFQTQGIAYSLDNGDLWTKYEENPVIGNEGIKDFRDPKVFWYEDTQQWIMALVAGDHVKFYASDNLKSWEFLSDFGKNLGAHGGVWECPDLFPLEVDGSGEVKWVLLVSINPGAPNGGSGTQYFVGHFDGRNFTTKQTDTKWIDWGTDNYAGVTYNNTPNEERIFIGWMSNWDYARDTPTEKWRSAMTLPRKLSLVSVDDTYSLLNYPLENFSTVLKTGLARDIKLQPQASDSLSFDHFNQSELQFNTQARDFELKFKNPVGDVLTLKIDGTNQQFLVDRRESGHVNFKEEFADKIFKMPMSLDAGEEIEFRILMDWSSIEIFVNKGQFVMTHQIFPREHFNVLEINNLGEVELQFNNFEISKAESTW